MSRDFDASQNFTEMIHRKVTDHTVNIMSESAGKCKMCSCDADLDSSILRHESY